MTKICKIDGCDRPIKARGWCNSHHRRWLRHNDPLAGQTTRGAAREWIERNQYYDGDECLIWPFSTDGYGYGSYNKAHYGERKVHRIMCAFKNGPSPSSKHEAAHSCGNGALGCVNPNHLSWKTREKNQADRLLHGTHNRGSRHGMSKLTEEDVLAIRALQGRLSQAKIGKKFSISQPLVCAIHQRKRWDWLP